MGRLVPPAGGSAHAGPPAWDAGGKGTERTFALTRHSLSLSTRHFRLDLAWQRLEVPAGEPIPPSAQRGRRQNRTQAHTPAYPEMRRRLQLASLLALEPHSPGRRQTLQRSSRPKPPAAALVCRTYARVGAVS